MKQRPPAEILALDLGTSSVRSALFDAAARPIPGSRCAVAYSLRQSVAHAAELDPATLLCAAKKCVRQTFRLTNSPNDGLTIGGCGFWHSLLGLDRKGDPLTPIFTWADSRAQIDARRLRERFDETEIHRRTGCMLRASFWPAKLVWLRRTQAKLFRRVARWVSPAEWIFAKVFDARICSHSMASGSGIYHFVRQNWDEELLDFCGLTNEQLNPLQNETRARAGEFSPQSVTARRAISEAGRRRREFSRSILARARRCGRFARATLHHR